MTFRDASDYNEASYYDDPPADSLHDHIAELLSRRVSKMDDRLTKLVASVVTDLLKEGRLGALVDINRLTGRETMARIIAEVIDSPQPRLMACCVDFVFRLGVQTAKNETKIADDFNVTKATVSRYCVHLKDVFLDGKPAPGMKSAEAVENYKALRTGKTRTPRQPWAFQSTITSTFNQ